MIIYYYVKHNKNYIKKNLIYIYFLYKSTNEYIYKIILYELEILFIHNVVVAYIYVLSSYVQNASNMNVFTCCECSHLLENVFRCVRVSVVFISVYMFVITVIQSFIKVPILNVIIRWRDFV